MATPKHKVMYRMDFYTCTGNTYYSKKQLITSDKSPYWSKPRPITKETFEKAKKSGYMCFEHVHEKELADIILFEDIIRWKQIHEEWKNNIGV